MKRVFPRINCFDVSEADRVTAIVELEAGDTRNDGFFTVLSLVCVTPNSVLSGHLVALELSRIVRKDLWKGFVRKRGKEISQKILLCPRMDAAFIPRFGLYLNSGTQCTRLSGMAKVMMMMMIDE